MRSMRAAVGVALSSAVDAVQALMLHSGSDCCVAPASCLCVRAGQYGKVCGFIEPLDEDSAARYVFSNEMLGTIIPPEYYPACEKGFREAANAGALIGAPVEVSRECGPGAGGGVQGVGTKCLRSSVLPTSP
jgi:hypothetical protein